MRFEWEVAAIAVPDDFSLDQIDHVFGDIRGVVGDAFDLPRGREHVNGWLDQVGTTLHETGQFVDDLAV